MKKRISMIFLLSIILLLGSFSSLAGQDSQLRPKKELNSEFVLDAQAPVVSEIQVQEETGSIIQDLEEVDPLGDWLSQFAWYQKIERLLPGLILIGLLLGKVAKYTPGKQDDLITGAIVLLARLLQRKKPAK